MGAQASKPEPTVAEKVSFNALRAVVRLAGAGLRIGGRASPCQALTRQHGACKRDQGSNERHRVVLF